MKFSTFLNEHNRLAIDIDISTQNWLREQNIDVSKCTMTPDGLDVHESHVYIKRVPNGKLPVKFNRIYGNFRISMCDLTTLEGCPKSCYDFDCSQNQKLTSLKYSPIEIEADFRCSHTAITSFEGMSKKIGGGLYAEECHKLSSLSGAPKTIGDVFMLMGCKSLQTLKHGPSTVGSTYNASNCDLRSLEGAPNIITGSFGVGGNWNLTTLEGGPARVTGNYVIDNTPKLKSLHNIHKHIKMCGEFHCNGYKSHMLGVTMISSVLSRTIIGELFSDTRFGIPDLDIIYKILKSHMGEGMDGAINAQSDLLDHGYDEVAQL